jgi:2-polyprenyl-6-methoxyphenol hydroxylase-like FAD-dependent oxidoreductase
LLNDLALKQAAQIYSGGSSASTAGQGTQQPRRPAGHFAGILFDYDKIDTSKWEYRLPSPAFTNMATIMEHIESVLAARANAMGLEIRRGLGVEDFDQSDEGVTIRAGGETFHGRWLVGCDGGRSTVRKVGGFAFVGTDPEFTGYSVQVEMADPDKLAPGRHYTPMGMYSYAQPGTVAMVDFDGGAFHRTQPITLEHVQAVLHHISGTDVTVTALALATPGRIAPARRRLTATGECCSPATPRTSIPPWVARGSTSGSATR